ncbi:MAG: hypothetical protein HYV63_30715 [Candidatus Schekmanbacteria bacterium]|nr:hypothetical protein [Candidatus Schekmanbacteria bacterium]
MELRQPLRQSPSPAGRPSLPALLWVAQIVIITGVAAVVLLSWTQAPRAGGGSGGGGAETERLRGLAAKLKTAGLSAEAEQVYSALFAQSALEPAVRAQVAFSIGEMLLEGGEVGRALRWFYEADSLGPPQELGSQVGARIVQCLEQLGRVHAAQAALKRHTALGETVPTDASAAAPAGKPDDPVVAEVGDRKVYQSDLMQALDDLGPYAGKELEGEEGLGRFLQKYVADDLLYRKAQRLQLDRDPDVVRKVAMVERQLVVSKLIDKELIAKIAIDDSDVRTYFEANKARYAPAAADGKTPPPPPKFEDVAARVRQDYRQGKLEQGYRAMIDETLSAEEVHLFPERLRRDPTAAK